MARTLRAAAVDSGAREALERGRLTDDLDPSGFGPFGGAQVKPTSRPKADERENRAAEREERKRKERELREEIRTLRDEVRAAERDAAAAERELKAREKAVANAREQLERALARREA
jgi:outer membrane protein TolC